MIVEIEELEKLDASETNPRRENAKEVLISEPKKMKFCISCCRWFSKIIRKRLRIPRTHSEADRKERVSVENLMVFLGSRRSSERISFIVIILNREVQQMCREKNQSLFTRFVYIIERNSSEKKFTMRVEKWRSQNIWGKKQIQFFLVLQGKDGILYSITTLRELRGIQSYVRFRRFWRSVSQRRMLRETEKHK